MNTARPFIFSTAPPPPAAAAALAALELLEEGPERTERLQANAGMLRDELAREGFEVAGSTTQIVPLIVGDAAQAMRICELAIERACSPRHPPADGARGDVAAAPGGDGLPRRAELREAAQVLGRAALRAGWRRARACPSRPGGAPASVRRRAPGRLSAMRGVFVTGTDTGVGKTVVAAAWPPRCATPASTSARSSLWSPGIDEPDGDRPPDHELLARPRGARRRR